MTREEAIKRLKEYSQYAYGIYHNGQKDEEAFDMAIESLQGDMYCPNCGVRLVTEDEYFEPTQKFERKE